MNEPPTIAGTAKLAKERALECERMAKRAREAEENSRKSAELYEQEAQKWWKIEAATKEPEISGVPEEFASVCITDCRVSKGGQNPTNTSDKRPPAPMGSGGQA